MSEAQLRARVHLASYGITASVALLLAVQNFRFGFYTLVYAALGIAALASAGAVLSFVLRHQQTPGNSHLALLTAINGIALVAAYANATQACYWLFPLFLLNLLLVPLRHAMLLLAISLTLLTPSLIAAIGLTGALRTLFALLLVGGIASLYAWRYQHNVRSEAELSTTHPITGALNRRLFDETLDKEISRSGVTGHALSLLLIEIDYFAQSLELHGGGALNNLLRSLSDHLYSMIRAGDNLYYAEEGKFLLLLPFTPEEGARVIAERIRRSIAERQWPLVESLTASLGGTTYVDGMTSRESIMHAAGKALKTAQTRGHDRVDFVRLSNSV